MRQEMVTTTSGFNLQISVSPDPGIHADPMVLVQGFGGGNAAWPPEMVAELAEEAPVVTYNLRGVGGKGIPTVADPAQFTVADMVADHREVLLAAREELTRGGLMSATGGFHHVGWSLGSCVSLACASAHPELVARTVLLTPSPGRASRLAIDPDAATLQALTRPQSFPDPIDTFLGIWSSCLSSEQIQQFRPDLVALAQAIIQAGPVRPKSAVGHLNAWTKFDATEILSLLEGGRYLLIGGTADRLSQPAMLAAMHGALPGSQLMMLEGAQHMPQITHRNELLRAVRQFLYGN